MTRDEFAAEIAAAIEEILRSSPAVHKRRVAIRQGNREPVTNGCDHSNWSGIYHWCRDCGITKLELLSKP